MDFAGIILAAYYSSSIFMLTVTDLGVKNATFLALLSFSPCLFFSFFKCLIYLYMLSILLAIMNASGYWQLIVNLCQ